MPEERGERRDHQDQRQDLEGEDEQRPAIGDGVGLRPACEISEDEAGALTRGRGQAVDARGHGVEHALALRDPEQRQHQGRLQEQGPDHQPPGKALAVLRDRPAEGQDRDQPHEALRVVQAEHVPSDGGGGRVRLLSARQLGDELGAGCRPSSATR
jgi:hypothetical protein